MHKKLISLISIIFMLSVASPCIGADDPSLMGWWTFDGHSNDVSGNDRHGTLNGDPQFVPGVFGPSIELDGDDYVTIDGYKGILGTNPLSIACWIRTTNTATQQIVLYGTDINGQRIEYRIESDELRLSNGNGNARSTTAVNDGEWHHIVVTLPENALIDDARFYLDGQPDTLTRSDADSLFNMVADWDVTIGYRPTRQDRPFIGNIDELGIYDRVLTQEEIQELMLSGGGEPYPFALSPTPADDALIEATWVSLEWLPSSIAVSHDVYFGESFDDVNDGTNDALIGNQAESIAILGLTGYPYPEGLVPGTTYYWRIDEVNNADPNSPWKSEVWSFTIPPRTAYNLSPADGDRFVDPNVELSWTGGYGAILHHVYFGDNFDDVNDGTGDTHKGASPDTIYTPGTLELDKTYYWRVDEFDSSSTNNGDVMRFQTFPDVQIPITDPNLVGWWKLEEGQASVAAVDSSGHGHHGNVAGDSQWIAGYDGGSLEFAGVGYVQMKDYKGVLGTHAFSVSAWVRTSNTAIQGLLWWGTNSGGQRVEFRIHSNGHIRMGAGNGQVEGRTDVTDGQWHHVLATVAENATNSSSEVRIYIDGEDDTLESTDEDAFDITAGLDVTIGWRPSLGDRALQGSIDDVRIYDKVLTLTEIEQIMRIDLQLAWKPGPANGSTPDIENTTPLTWTAGDMAIQHDVYFGTDRDAVKDANTSTVDIYRGRQNTTSYTPPEGVEWGAGPYYWRVDENNTDGTVTSGRVWSFTVTDFILVDDFETYDANDNQIWYAWHDGLGYGTPDFPPYFTGNGTGAAVGDENSASYTEETIVNSGNQSMPLFYDNNKQDYSNYSEAELTLIAPRDWSKHELAELSLWFRGYPPSVGSFTEAPAGTYTMTGSGADITGTADEFHYAFKMLNGPGSIVAKVESVSNTHAWAKAGLMIRETLESGSKHALACVTPGNGVAFEGRTTADSDSFSTNEGGITAPYWVKLERDIAGNFKASHSADGSTWNPVGSSVPMGIPMDSSVYVGLALTSHNAALTCEAVFSNVTITETVAQTWTNQDIGILGNSPEPMYAALSNLAGTSAVVYNDDPNAATTDIWTEWVIPLQAFADQGVNFTDVDRIAIGMGTQGNMTIPGGSGTMFFDDIRLYRLRPEPEPEPEL